MSSQLMDEIWLLAEEAWKAYEGDNNMTGRSFDAFLPATKDRWFRVGTKMYEYRHSADLS